MQELNERIARLETKTKVICSDLKEIKEDIKELRHSVNEELEIVNKRVTLLENQMVSFTILKKVLVFIAGAFTSGIIYYLIQLVV